MTQFRIMDALTLQRERQRAINRRKNIFSLRGERINVNTGCVSKVMLAKALYPKQTGKTLNSTGTWLTTGRVRIQMISNGMMQIICDILGVDANFLIGLESIHDKDFNRLVNIDNK